MDVFTKLNEQSRTCSSYTMAKINEHIFTKMQKYYETKQAIIVRNRFLNRFTAIFQVGSQKWRIKENIVTLIFETTW